MRPNGSITISKLVVTTDRRPADSGDCTSTRVLSGAGDWVHRMSKITVDSD